MELALERLTTQVLDARYTECQTWWAGPLWHCDPFARLYWVEAGEAFVTHHGQRFHLLPGRAHLIPAQVPGLYQCPERMRLWWAHFNANLHGTFELFRATAGGGWELDLPAADHAAILQRWERLVACQALAAGSPAARLEADGLLRQLLAPFLTAADHATTLRQQRELAKIAPVLRFMEDQLARKLTLAELARVAHLQPTYFSNLFNRVMGEPPITWLNRRRTDRARGLLEAGTDLKEVAAATGFRDAFYFSRVFRRLVGVPPASYRDHARERMP